MLKNEIRKGIITSIYRTQFEFNKEMNTRSMTKKMLANNANIINDNNMDDNDIMRQKFANEIRDLTNINTANQDTSYKSLKARLRPIPIVAKKIYNEYADIMPHYSDNQNGRLLSVFYLTLHRLMNEADNLHRKEYIDSEKRILKIRKMTLNINKKCRKCLFMLWDIIQNFDNKNLIPKYDLVVEKHNQLLNQYDLRPRNAVYYGEEDQVDDLSDADYSPNDDNLNQRLARINKAVSFVVNKYSNKRRNADDDSEYNPSDDKDNDDDHVLEFDEDDYADELEDDDDDYEDEDEYRQADLEFLDEYFNDPDYIETKKSTKRFDKDEDDEEYLPEDDDDDDDDDDDYLLDTVSECDYKDDSSSDYDPSEDADDENDDEQLLFDDDDYAEETEENDDDYEDDSEDAEDAQFVSDYFNDPDYDPNDDIEEDDELEYDFSFKNKKDKENIELVLEAGIENEEDDDDSNDYDPNEEDEDEDEDEEVMYSCKKNNLINVCKRFYDRKTGKVRYNWVHMNAEDYAKKYDEDYEDNEEM